MQSKPFSYKNLLSVFGLTAIFGVGMYATAYQFNDGKITPDVIGWVLIGMALPSLFIGGVMRMFRPDLQRYFAITAALCIFSGIFVKWLF
jgi:hypothetical protein